MSYRIKMGLLLLAMIVSYYGVMGWIEFKDNCERVQYEATNKSIDWGK